MLSSQLRQHIKAAVSKNAPVFLAAQRGFASKKEAAPLNGTAIGPNGVVRPISPDLAIWKFSLTAYLHVGVRISGAVLASGFSLAGLYALFFSCDIPHALDSLKLAAPILVPIWKMCVAAPLTYHLLGGYRQLYHDFTAKGMNAEFQDKSSLALGSVTAAATLFFAFYGY